MKEEPVEEAVKEEVPKVEKIEEGLETKTAETEVSRGDGRIEA